MSTTSSVGLTSTVPAAGKQLAAGGGPGPGGMESTRFSGLNSNASERSLQSARSKSVPSVQEVNQISRESVEAAAEKIQSFVTSMERNLNIYVDNSSGRSIIRVVDPESSQVIRQIPPEESIRLAQTVDFLASLLVHQRA
jgi:flagellar protein FlaG